MKKIVFPLLFVFLFIGLKAQDDNFETLSTRGKVSGFGGPIMSFTQIDKDFVHLMGGGGGIIINDFFLGGYGVGKTNEIYYKDNVANVMLFGHGGLWFGYTFFGNKAIHPVIHTQMGWGKITQYQKGWQSAVIIPEPLSVDEVFVLSPTAEIELNFSRFFRLGGGVNYNFVYNTDGAYSFEDFAKPGFFVSFKFGYFR